MITNSGQLCMLDHWLQGRRPETAAVGIGDVLHVVGQILWRQTMQALANEHLVTHGPYLSALEIRSL